MSPKTPAYRGQELGHFPFSFPVKLETVTVDVCSNASWQYRHTVIRLLSSKANSGRCSMGILWCTSLHVIGGNSWFALCFPSGSWHIGKRFIWFNLHRCHAAEERILSAPVRSFGLDAGLNTRLGRNGLIISRPLFCSARTLHAKHRAAHIAAHERCVVIC